MKNLGGLVNIKGLKRVVCIKGLKEVLGERECWRECLKRNIWMDTRVLEELVYEKDWRESYEKDL